MRKIFLLFTGVFSLLASESQVGSLDPSFGENGVVYPDLPYFDILSEKADQVLLKSDGKLIVLFHDLGLGRGSVPADPFRQTIVTRYLPDGVLDSSFGKKGYSVVPISAAIWSTDRYFITNARAALQADDKIVIAGQLKGKLAVARLTADGEADDGFGNSGIITTDFGPSVAEATCLDIGKNGKIVTAGYASNGTFNDIVVTRYNNNGKLDPSFDKDGKQTIHFGDFPYGVSSLLIENNNRITFCGYSDFLNNNSPVLVLGRINNNGSADKSFGNEGISVTNLAGKNFSLALTSNAKIVVAGRQVLARFNAKGSIDSTFGYGGYGEIAAPIEAMAIQPDGKIVTTGGTGSIVTARYTAQGLLDLEFGERGLRTFMSRQSSYGTCISVQKNGGIIAGGYINMKVDFGISRYDYLLLRYLSDGSFDANFGNGTLVTGYFPAPHHIFEAAAMQKDGKIIVSVKSGNTISLPFYNSAFMIRYNEDGSRDKFMSESVWVNASDQTNVAIQGSSKILQSANSLIYRFNSDGTKDLSFGFQGYTDASMTILAMKVQSSGHIIVSGISENIFLLKRYKPNGTLDELFGTGGIVQINKVLFQANLLLAIQNDDKIVLTGTRQDMGHSNLVAMQLNSNGNIDTSFGEAGLATIQLGSNTFLPNAIAVEPNGKIVVAGTFATNANTDFVLCRINADGSLDATFGNSGVQTTDFNGVDSPTLPSIRDDGKILIAGTSTDESSTLIAIARYNPNGQLDETFGNKGRQLTEFANLGAGADYQPRALLPSDNRLYTAASNWSGASLLAAYKLEAAAPIVNLKGTGVYESDSIAKLVVTLSKPVNEPVQLRYQTIDGTAKSNEDYQSLAGTIILEPGQTTDTLLLTVYKDQTSEATEFFEVELSPKSFPTEVKFGALKARVTLFDGRLSGPSKFASHIDLNNLVIIYKHTNGGNIPENYATLLNSALDAARLFYWRHSYMTLNMKWTVYVIEDYLDRVHENATVYPSEVDADLRSRGFQPDSYDGVIAVVPGGGAYGWGANRVLGRAGYCQVPWWEEHYLFSWFFVHEFHHVIDAMFNYSGHTEYPSNHPGAARAFGEYVPHSGSNWDLNAGILHHWERAAWLDLRNKGNWGTIRSSVDNDLDTIPDADEQVALDEKRFNSKTFTNDSDNDGLTDLQEVMAGIFTESDPSRPDTDADGFPDGADGEPIYPLQTKIPFNATVSLDQDITEWPLSGHYLFDKPNGTLSSLHLTYSENKLNIGVKIPSYVRHLQVIIDANNDGLFYGNDNIEVLLAENTISAVNLFDAAAVPPGNQQDYITLSLPTIGFSGITKTGIDWSSYQLTIPALPQYGLSLTPGKKIGIYINIVGYVGSSSYGPLLEPDDLLTVTLGDSNPSLVNKTMQNGAIDNSDKASSLKVSIYPNPSSQTFSLHWSGAQERIHLVVTDVLGRIVERRSLFGSEGTIQFGNKLEPGNYQVEAIEGNRKKVIKLIKN